MHAFLVYICQLDYYKWTTGRLTVRRAWEGPEPCHLDMAQPVCARMCELNAALLSSPSCRQGYVH